MTSSVDCTTFNFWKFRKRNLPTVKSLNNFSKLLTRLRTGNTPQEILAYPYFESINFFYGISHDLGLIL
jgi:hypothetical protein